MSNIQKKLAEIRAGLEDFTDNVDQTVTSVAEPAPSELADVNPEVAAQQTELDDGIDELGQAASALEDILALAEDAPGEDDAPIEGFAAKSINSALESADMAKLEDGESKKSFAEKGKDFIAKLIKAIMAMAAKLGGMIKQAWAAMTDRLTKNIAWAKQNQSVIASLATDTTKKITDEKVLKAVASVNNEEPGQLLLNAIDFANVQANKGSKELLSEAKKALGEFSRSKFTDERESPLNKLNEVLSKSGSDVYTGEASEAQGRAVNAPNGSTVFVSDPFFGGLRGWMTIPADDTISGMTVWNHGISKVDEVTVAQSIAAPGSDEMSAICKTVIDAAGLINVYRGQAKELEELERGIKSLQSVANKELPEQAAKDFKTLSTLMPRIIKGPQVAAYNYAVTASSIALRYVSAGITAHKQKEAAAA